MTIMAILDVLSPKCHVTIDRNGHTCFSDTVSDISTEYALKQIKFISGNDFNSLLIEI